MYHLFLYLLYQTLKYYILLLAKRLKRKGYRLNIDSLLIFISLVYITIYEFF